jgi:hypothetical protein
MTFVECYLEGAVQENDIEWWVTAWHAGIFGSGLLLHEYLGLTWDEYAQWASDPSALPHILEARTGSLHA